MKHYSFFALAKVGLDGRPHLLFSPNEPECDPADSDGFDAAMFPLRVVSAVGLQAGLQPYDDAIIRQPQLLRALPGSKATQVSRWPRSVVFHSGISVLIDGERQGPRDEIQLVGKLEGHACCYVQLLTSAEAVEPNARSFLTNRDNCFYAEYNCEIESLIGSWSEVPRCEESFKQALRIGQPVHFRWGVCSEIERRIERAAAEVHAQSLERFRQRALQEGPGIGSFIPCALWDDREAVEEECVLEITGKRTGRRTGAILHVLSERPPRNLRPGMRLRTRVEVRDNTHDSNVVMVRDLGHVARHGFRWMND